MKNVLLVDFDSEANAYEGFNRIKDVRVEESEVLEAALVREKDGHLEIKESVGLEDNDASGTLAGGLVGAILGLFTGGFGWILWGSIGLLVGALFDDHEDNKEQSLLEDMSKKIHHNNLSIIAVADESNYNIIDHQFDGLHATITRYDMSDIENEIEETNELNKRIAKAAKKELREKRKEARHQKIVQAKDKVFHHKKDE